MFHFVSPIYKKPLAQKDYKTLTCQDSGEQYAKVAGVWQMIAPERVGIFDTFIREYETVRQAEGRTDSAKLYAQLPYPPADHPLASMWQQRALSYEAFVNIILTPKETINEQLTIIDLGAGNGWLSNRLAQRGHGVAAVDLTLNRFDGLGVHEVYEKPFVSIQAEFDHLPLAPSQFDLAIFNASLHYSADYATTLSEALQLLKPTGTLAIIDTPVYDQKETGLQMVIERERAFEAKHGFRSNSLQSKNFLTQNQILSLEDELQLEIQTYYTVPPLRRTVRRLKRQLNRLRPAAEFPLISLTPKRGTHAS